MVCLGAFGFGFCSKKKPSLLQREATKRYASSPANDTSLSHFIPLIFDDEVVSIVAVGASVAPSFDSQSLSSRDSEVAMGVCLLSSQIMCAMRLGNSETYHS